MKFKKEMRNFLLSHPKINPYRFSTENVTRKLTSNSRILPNFLIIGYHKSGTTSLYRGLTQFENIGNTSKKEIQYFGTFYSKGLSWYKSHFPTIDTKEKVESMTNMKFLVGESSGEYIFHPLSLARIKKTIPNIKLILLLRNPIDRAYSHYMYERKIGWEIKKTFEDAIKEDDKRNNIMNKKFRTNEFRTNNKIRDQIPYLSIGKYVIHIKRLFEIFPKEQILILKSSELEEMPIQTIERVLKFLQLPTKQKINFGKENVGKYDSMNLDTRKRLIEYYKPYNAELEKILKIKIDWDK